MLALRIPAARFTVDLAPVLRVSCLSWLLIDRCRWFLFGRLFIVGCLTLLSCHAMTDGSSVPCFSSDLLASQGYEPLSGKHEVLYRGDLPWEVRGGARVRTQKRTTWKPNRKTSVLFRNSQAVLYHTMTYAAMRLPAQAQNGRMISLPRACV